MKKILLAILIIVALVFLSDKIYKIYSRSNVNSHESVVLLNSHLQSDKIDSFFNLEEGTFNPTENNIVFSLPKKNGHLLDYYINLPVKNIGKQMSNFGFECDIDYENVRPYGFYDYEIDNINIVVRIIEKTANVAKHLNSSQIIAQKYLGGNFHPGQITILDVTKNGISNHCK